MVQGIWYNLFERNKRGGAKGGFCIIELKNIR